MIKNKKIICVNCQSDKLDRKYITWATNGATVEKIKCKECGENMWRTNLSQEEIKQGNAKEKISYKNEKQLEFDF